MPDYGNWIRKRIIVVILAIAAVALVVGLLPLPPLLRVLALLVSAITGLTALFIIAVYYAFSSSGGDYQRKLWRFVFDHLDWDGAGTALDIGTGNGPLAVQLAKAHPSAHVTGIDYWGADWDYSQAVCIENARIEGVAERVTFQKASAAALPFEPESFDAVVSHFVFHEVADAADKRDVIREALRVLKPGGAFSFQDMFYDRALYGDPDALLAAVRGWGISEVRLVDTRRELAISLPLRHPRVLGKAGLICGRK